MTIEEAAIAFNEKIFILTVTNDFVFDIKKAIKEMEGSEIIEELRIDNKMVAFKIKLASSTYGLFTLGAIVQINRTVDSKFQKEFDKIIPQN